MDVRSKRGLRIALSACVLLPVLFGQYSDVLVQLSPFLLERDNAWSRNLLEHLSLLRLTVVCSTLLFALGLRIRITGTVSALSFHCLDYLSFAIETHAWNFTTHLQLFILLLAWCPEPQDYMEIYCCLLYFQAGISKLWVGGLAWCTAGTTLRGIVYFHGSDLGRSFLDCSYLFPFLATLAVLLELSVLPLYFSPLRPWIPLILIAFHCGIFLFMNVSFWQLWILYPFLFRRKENES